MLARSDTSGRQEQTVHSYLAHILGPRGSSQRLDILATDLTHARSLARDHGAACYGRRGFSFTVREAGQ
jgi:hypothetical protein